MDRAPPSLSLLEPRRLTSIQNGQVRRLRYKLVIPHDEELRHVPSSSRKSVRDIREQRNGIIASSRGV
ncbi:hypothetical protein C8035_v006124 [Colletotrichum spinosum]|uniref:Uncharacterized protein n=1 Tax=Colletotrichum spinosum TaxID=1347390 RepID=A0A4R8QAZ9_9PEZI|nr:hypothetical protein C8035_v006124 [Colletotrichum spinosum]